ncbi:McrC family protein [Microbacterium sp. A93]|uniref:McrC family protein n=1 Tax=Microbacterium sp. A93 TaxID=3450716 RepID=UPI003F430D5C
MTIDAEMTTRTYIAEKGRTHIRLTLNQARDIQALEFCRVTPTQTEGQWVVTDVKKVGVAVVDGLTLHVVPKTPLENIVYMASLGEYELRIDDETAQGIDDALPTAIASAFLIEVERATRRGLVKGYRTVEESAAVVRGRWDIARQLAVRPGIPLPLEIEFDDFTDDILENEILTSALRVVSGIDALPSATAARLRQLQVTFADVAPLPRGVPIPERPLTPLTQHYAAALRLARVILESVSWTHRHGAHGGGTFLVNMAEVFEKYVASRLSTELDRDGMLLTTQDRRWWLDTDRTVALKPDIVVSREADVVTVADTKYKVIGDDGNAATNADVYQAVAYALALGVPDAHLIYVSGDVIARVLRIPTAGISVHLHAVSLDGSPQEIAGRVAALAQSIADSSSAESRAHILSTPGRE